MKKFITKFFDFRANRSEASTAAGVTIALLVISMAVFASAQAVTLNVTVNTALTFTTAHSNFPNITPGTPVYATTTLQVTTNDVNGWTMQLYGGNKSTGNNNLQSGSNSIPDQNEWIPGAATTSAGNAVAIASLANSGNVLAFRVMSASSTNGAPFLATTWWGANDGAGALWAGIGSTTAANKLIGQAGAGSYSASTHYNTVQYYLNVAATQPTGAYSAPLTYTATGL